VGTYNYEQCDDPNYWMRERSYFGQIAAVRPTSTVPATWWQKLFRTVPPGAGSRIRRPRFDARPRPLLGAVTPPAPPWYQKVAEALAPAVATGLTLYQKAQIDKLNRKRLAQGLEPIPPEKYREALGPAVTAEVGLSPATRNMLLIGALGLGAVLVLPRLLRR